MAEKKQETNKLVEAVLEVMKDVKGIDKSLNVGMGNSSYKGVADKDVKKVIGEAMQKHELAIFPIRIEPTQDTNAWNESTQWGEKRKQQVFTEVLTTYLLMHSSGESIEIQGYGHGIDSQDKSAGKATTYALKYALLYQFLVPTGTIDDADTTHSDSQEVPSTKAQSPAEPKPVPKSDLETINTIFTEPVSKSDLETINGITTLAELREFYKANEGKGKLFASTVTRRKKELEAEANPQQENDNS